MNTETKRHIDSARQVLVGVVPNPTSQIDQITNALIYKFMDDMDQSAIKAGGDASFFVGDLEKYAWTRLMDPRLGNQERMNLYSEALLKFSESKQLPELFRGIFKSAFLPYRSPETLGMFLKEINYFDYSHPEELGNAYEYLLSIMSSQGDAGQFRTPRHIIDFIVEAVNPTKDDKVLDPACGTAGFLISAYKHILAQHDGKDDPNKKEKPLTPDQRKNLFNNFEGYDIDPGMVRIAEVNMYLHQFKNPKIFQYDSLSMEDRWNDKFDVIMANPPFMSPKGGIKPHTKFSIQSSRSEVLFVDYIMNHLRPHGRAGIIVPEGIIFQLGTAYKQLRKNLIEDGLYAVVSLPSGVFNPYANVKTSILLFDNELAKQKSEILFIKIENDGFDLGAQRKANNKNDLPEATEVIAMWKEGSKVTSKLATYVEKLRISESGDYNLSCDRYHVSTDYSNAKWPMVELSSLCDLLNGYAFKSSDYIKSSNTLNFRMSNIRPNGQSDVNYNPRYLPDSFVEKYKEFIVENGDVVIAMTDMASDPKILGVPTIVEKDNRNLLLNQRVGKFIKIDREKIFVPFLKHVLTTQSVRDYYKTLGGGGLQVNINKKDILKINIPLPPIEIQKLIVSELNGYQRIIDGAKQVTVSWKPKIDIDPEWEKVKLGDICDFMNGKAHEEFIDENGKYIVVNSKFIATDCKVKKYSNKFLSPLLINDVVMVMSDVPNGRALAKCFLVDKNDTYTLNQRIGLFRPKNPEKLNASFLYLQLNRNRNLLEYDNHQSQSNLRRNEILDCPFFLPAIEEQKQIVEKIEVERVLVDSAIKLIEIYEDKIKKKIGEVWGE